VRASISRTGAAATSAVLAERQTCSDLGLHQARTTRCEEPMVETARAAAALPGLGRTELRTLQRHGGRRDLP